MPRSNLKVLSPINSVKKLLISIDKNPAFLQAFEHVISISSRPYKMGSGLGYSRRYVAHGNRAKTSKRLYTELRSRAVKTFLGYLCTGQGF